MPTCPNWRHRESLSIEYDLSFIHYSHSTTLDASAPSFLTLQELFKQLFTAIISAESGLRLVQESTDWLIYSADSAFIQRFFLVYRRFCCPTILMAEFLLRLQEIESATLMKDMQLWALLRCVQSSHCLNVTSHLSMVGALIDWSSRYPGDLADDKTQALFSQIIVLVLRHTFMAHLTADLVAIEANINEAKDIDVSWAMRPDIGLRNGSAANLSLASDDTGQDRERMLSLSEMKTSFSHPDLQLGPRELFASRRTVSTSEATSKSNKETSETRWLASQEDMGFSNWANAYAFVIGMDPRSFAMELTRLQWEVFGRIRVRLSVG
jgi:hypothetical protein